MANRDSTTNEPASTTSNKPFHEDFSWLPDNIKESRSAQFAAHVRTVASGCGVIASITRQHMIDSDNGTRTLLGANHMDLLVGLLEPLMSMLDDAACNQIDGLVSAAEEAVKKGGAK
jgi:hypothetical protein